MIEAKFVDVSCLDRPSKFDYLELDIKTGDANLTFFIQHLLLLLQRYNNKHVVSYDRELR